MSGTIHPRLPLIGLSTSLDGISISPHGSPESRLTKGPPPPFHLFPITLADLLPYIN